MDDEKNEEKNKEIIKTEYDTEVGDELSQISPSWYADTDRKKGWRD